MRQSLRWPRAARSATRRETALRQEWSVLRTCERKVEDDQGCEEALAEAKALLLDGLLDHRRVEQVGERHVLGPLRNRSIGSRNRCRVPSGTRMASLSIEPGSGDLAELVASNRSRVEGDKRTDGVEPRSYFPDASVDQTEARNARRLHPVCDGAGGEAPTAVDLDGAARDAGHASVSACGGEVDPYLCRGGASGGSGGPKVGRGGSLDRRLRCSDVDRASAH